LQFQIRVCPALQLKPKLPTPDFDPAKDDDKKKFDPFAPPYVPDLYVGDLKSADGEDYVILVRLLAYIADVSWKADLSHRDS
jgi:sulfate adenylyltransferase (ADP) / ATP adenylyltransferase